jgi:Gpi18-like mannosyltransferase
MEELILWAIIRFVTSAVAGLVSEIKPMTPIEGMIPFLPPTLPLGQWLERSFLSPWMRWDALWYQKIITQGYSQSDGTAQFHPLFPWLATPLVKIGFPASLSLLIISSISAFVLFVIFRKLLLFDLNQADAFFGLLLFTFTPISFILFAPYPEALFLLFAVLCLFWSRKKQWWLAGLAGGLAALTRQQGVLLLFPMAWELWEDAGRKFNSMLIKWKSWFAIGLIPFGMAIWLVYRAFFLSDFLLDFSNFHTFIYSFLISPSASQVVQNQQFLWPWHAFYLLIQKIILQPDIDIWVNAIIGILFIFILAFTWKKMRISYRIYSLVIAFVSFSYYTGPIHPYMGLPRHLFLAFPIFIPLTQIINKSWMRLLALSISLMGMLFLLTLYTLNSWVP